MRDFEYVLTLARGFMPAAPVALPRCDVIELRPHTLRPGQGDAPVDQSGREFNEAQETKSASDKR